MTDPSPPSVRKGPLAAAALRMLRAAPRDVWVALAGLAIFSASMRAVAGQLGIAVDVISLTPGYITYLALGALASTFAVGLVLHSLLTGRPPPRLGRGFWAFVAFNGTVAMLSSGLAALSVGAAQADPEGVALRFLVVSVGLIGGLIVVVRLLLLPIAWLVNDPGMTARESWARMRGQVLPYVAASIVLSLPITLLVIIVAGIGGATPGVPLSPPLMVMQEFLMVAYVAVMTGLQAAMYRRRAGDPEPGVAEVFD